MTLANGVDHDPALRLLKYLETGFYIDSKAVVFEIEKAERLSGAEKSD